MIMSEYWYPWNIWKTTSTVSPKLLILETKNVSKILSLKCGAAAAAAVWYTDQSSCIFISRWKIKKIAEWLLRLCTYLWYACGLTGGSSQPPNSSFAAVAVVQLQLIPSVPSECSSCAQEQYSESCRTLLERWTIQEGTGVKWIK